jgi:hypothetical protein
VTDDQRHHSGAGVRPGDAASGDWREVAEALNALGESIAHATTAAIDNEENRRRLRELSDGLAALSRRVVETVETAVTTPEAREVGPAAVQAAETVGDVGTQVARQVPPHVLNVIQATNEKFRQAAEQFKTPVPEVPAETVSADTAPLVLPVGPVGEASGEPAETDRSLEAEHEVSIHAWLFPEEAGVPIAPAAEPATPAPPAAPVTAPETKVSPVDAVRVAHERFQAERKAAEAAAAASVEKAHTAQSGEVPRPVLTPPSDDDAPLW